MDVELALDELHVEDVVFKEDGLVILANTFTKEYIGSTVKLDYGTGFRLGTPNETIGYGLSIKRKHQ